MKKFKTSIKVLAITIAIFTFSPSKITAQIYTGNGANSFFGFGGSAIGTFNGVGSATGNYALAAGQYNNAFGQYSVCIGDYNKATSNFAMAFGSHCESTANNAFTMGDHVKATSSHAMAFGNRVSANGNSSFIIGTGTIGETPFNFENNIPNSLMIGFNCDQIPTVYVTQQTATAPLGKVGIGTTILPTNLSNGTIDISYYTLYVEGGMLTDEVRVRTSWADYVFKDDYDLKPLFEVESFINKNGHLPNVPSASEVESGGIELGEITKIQQEKIEELTLYIISQQKQIDELKIEMDALKAK